jgi:hypothetical protein
MKSAAVAAPAAPCGPLRSTITGTTGSKIWKLIPMEMARAASTKEGLAREIRAAELPGRAIPHHKVGMSSARPVSAVRTIADLAQIDPDQLMVWGSESTSRRLWRSGIFIH